MSENIREIILDTLMEYESKDLKSHLLIRSVQEKYDYLSNQDKAFFKRVAEGTIAGRITIDYVINCFSSVKISKCKPLIRSILRMSVYQILYMDKVPDSAVCNETVKLCKKRHFQNLSGFVNGVLRNISRNKVTCLDDTVICDLKQRMSIRYSMPEWIVSLLMEEQPDCYEEILRATNSITPLTVRLTAKGQAHLEELTKRWSKAGIVFRQNRWIPYAYELDEIQSMKELPGFNDGFLAVQDISSMLVGQAAGIEKNMTVIDVCAAPGGKTSHVADLLAGTGKVISRDISEKKVLYIRENVERFHYDNVDIQIKDATETDEEMLEKADVVIADVPCSGLGVMGKKSDIRYHLTEETVESINMLQRHIIDTVWRYVKPGGILIYSTCTIHKKENEDMVHYIVSSYPFVGESLKPYLPEEIFTCKEDTSSIQLLPHVHGTDGFFICRLKRKENQ